MPTRGTVASSDRQTIINNDLQHPSLGMNGSRMRCQARRGVQGGDWLAGTALCMAGPG